MTEAGVSWRCSLALFLAGFSVLLNLYVTQPILPAVSAGLAVPVSSAVWTITAGTLGVAVAAPFSGALSDRFGRRRLIGPAIIAMAIPGAGSALATNLSALLGLRFAQGLLTPVVFTAAVAYAQEEAPPSFAARLNATFVCGSVVGGFSGRFLTGVLTEHLGWRDAFWVLAAVTLLVGGGVLACLPRERRFVPAASLYASLRQLVAHGRNRPLLGICILGGSLLFSQVATFTYADLRLAGPPFRLGPGALGLVFAVFLFGVVATPLAGRAIVRVGHGRVLAFAVLLSCAGLLISQLPLVAAVVVGLACCSTGTFIGQACATNAAARFAPGAASSGVGLYVMSYYLGGGIGAAAPEPVWHAVGWPGCAVLIGVVLTGGLTVALLTGRRAQAALVGSGIVSGRCILCAS
jgi:predicted MFS family arabinose efflux permease